MKINVSKVIAVILIFFVLMFLVQYFLYVENHIYTISTYNINSSKIPKSFNGFKILQLSDLHNMNFGDNNDKLIADINRINPDVLAVTGDCLSSSDDKYNRFIDVLKGINKKINVIFISGNHEELFRAHSHKNNYKEYNKFISDIMENKVNIIDDKKFIILKKGDHINFYGFMIPLHFYYPGKFYLPDNVEINEQYMESKIGKPDKDSFNILFAHHPKYFEQYSSWGADLTLSGHIHGGVVRLPFLGGVLSPDRELFPKYDAGKFKIGTRTMIVSRGLGNSGLNQRIFDQPELVVITLHNN